VPELTETFVSPTMQFSVRYPSGWTVTPGTEPWLPGATSFWDDPDGDRLEGDGAGFRATSQALEAGQTATAWLDAYLRSARPFSCGDLEQVPVGDQSGTMDLNGCAGKGRLGGRVWDVALVVGGRGYNITMEGTVDRPFLLAMRASVRFLP
jgi:hypothetical protein